jgi:hypothetical protein
MIREKIADFFDEKRHRLVTYFRIKWHMPQNSIDEFFTPESGYMGIRVDGENRPVEAPTGFEMTNGETTMLTNMLIKTTGKKGILRRREANFLKMLDPTPDNYKRLTRRPDEEGHTGSIWTTFEDSPFELEQRFYKVSAGQSVEAVYEIKKKEEKDPFMRINLYIDTSDKPSRGNTTFAYEFTREVDDWQAAHEALSRADIAISSQKGLFAEHQRGKVTRKQISEMMRHRYVPRLISVTTQGGGAGVSPEAVMFASKRSGSGAGEYVKK